MKEGTKKLFESIKFCNLKLNFVLEITQKILDNHPTEEIMAYFSQLLSDKLAIKQMVFYVMEGNRWKLKFSVGVNERKYAALNVEKILGKYADITMIRDEDQELGQLDFVIPIMHKNKVQAYVLIGDLEDTSMGMSPAVKNLRFIQTVANIIVVAFEKRRLILEAIERERMKKELETAARIQRMLIPDVDSMPKNEHYKIHAFYLPHYELGGDLYDFGQLSNKEIYFAIADVSGKGLSAALLMSHFQANLRAQFASNDKLETIVKNLNEIVLKSSKGSHFITLFIAKYNIYRRRLIYVNAGHHPPFLYDKVTRRTMLLRKGSVGVGMLDKIPEIEVGKVKINNPSKLLLYTDGVSEIYAHNQQDFGFRKMQQLLADDDSIEKTIEKIKESLKLNKENPRIFDDVTLLGLEFL